MEATHEDEKSFEHAPLAFKNGCYIVPNNSELGTDLSYIMFRLDGHCFSTFTRQLEKPFDEKMHKAMVNTMSDAIEEFGFILGYTQSDEITFVLKPKWNEETKSQRDWPFNG